MVGVGGYQMGADLIGFNVIGARELVLSPRKKKAIADRITNIQAFVDNLDDLTEAEAALEARRLKLSPVFFLFLGGRTALPNGFSPREFVNAFIAFWNEPNTRDVVCRDLPKFLDPENKMKLVFAGDTSWGDEPDGWGYQMLETVARFDLWGAFGLE
jgi:hypothetical protein